MGLVLARKILKAHQSNGFCGAVVYGLRGIGKSSYSLKVLKEVFMTLDGVDEKEAYDRALKATKYRMLDIIKFIKSHANGGRVAPSLIIDDAGVGLSRYRWWVEPKLILRLQSVLDTVRSGVSSILMTCPSPKSVLGFVKRYDDFYVKIIKVSGEWRRKAIGYQQTTLPSGKTIVYKRFEDSFTCYLPNKVYKKYIKLRQSYLQDALAKLERITKASETETLGEKSQ